MFFMNCAISNNICQEFVVALGTTYPFIQIEHSVVRWWETDCAPKFMPLFISW